MKLHLFLVAALTASAQTITVSAGGPIQTLAAAPVARRAGRTGVITIQIGDCIHFLREPLVLTAEDLDTVSGMIRD